MPIYKNFRIFTICGVFFFIILNTSSAQPLKRAVSPKKILENSSPAVMNSSIIVLKLKEGTVSLPVINNRFQSDRPEIDKLNKRLEIISRDKATTIQSHFSCEKYPLDEWRRKGKDLSNVDLPDLSLYYRLRVTNLSDKEKIDLINDLNKMEIVEIAYFSRKAVPLSAPQITSPLYSPDEATTITPNWEEFQDHLKPAPLGFNSYYLWKYKNGKGENVKVVDVEFGWNLTHEDLRGGTGNFVIGLNSDQYRFHGIAVTGAIAADSNQFGMTGMAFNADLAGISVDDGTDDNYIFEEVLNAILYSDTGDVILIEVGISSEFLDIYGDTVYVPVEYLQENFDVIEYATALRRVVVQPAGNSVQNFDDPKYEGLFDTKVRNSGAIFVGASNWDHLPMWYMTNYGSRVDVHSYGRDVYGLCCGDLYGDNEDNYYSASGSGTSVAGALVAGACLQLQSLYKNMYHKVISSNYFRSMFLQYSTPQIPHEMHIGGMPDLAACAYSFTKFDFSADTLKGQAPFEVTFTTTTSETAEAWQWDFGDGGGDSIQNPTYSFTESGIYDIGVTMTSGGINRELIAESYILVTADSLFGDSVTGSPGSSVKVTFSGKNMLPLRKFIIPVSFGGPLSLTYDSCNTEGCRTASFNQFNLLSFDNYNKRLTLTATTDSNDPALDLAPGNGPILNLYFTPTISSDINVIDTVQIENYSTYRAEFQSPLFDYIYPVTPAFVTITTVGCCEGTRGNIDGDPYESIDISDMLYLVEYMFGVPPGPTPSCLLEVDVDNSSTVDLSDLLYLVDYFFKIPAGPAPLPCE